MLMMARWQVESCAYGFHGWLLWFWGADKDDEVITANVSDAVVGRAISPLVRADPCDPGVYESSNLALGRPVTASAEENEECGVARLVDGSDATWWSAANGPPQWAEIDLQVDREVSRVEILVGHVSPPGPQTHRVSVRRVDDASPGILAGEVSRRRLSGRRVDGGVRSDHRCSLCPHRNREHGWVGHPPRGMGAGELGASSRSGSEQDVCLGGGAERGEIVDDG
jgi:hypothetical protein